MSKLPFLQLYIGDWKKDPSLRMCSPSTRGIWFDWLLDMHELDRCGQLTGSIAQLARAGNCTTDEASIALSELKSTKAAEVIDCNGVVTVTNRRMQREYVTRISTLNRVRKHRSATPEGPPGNSSETDYISDVRGHNNNTHTAREGIPTEKECGDFAEASGFKRCDGESFWRHYSSQGWMKGSGLLITSWRPACISWCLDEARKRTTGNRGAKAQGSSPSINSIAQCDSVIAECFEEIKRIKNDPSKKERFKNDLGIMGDRLTESARAEIKKIETRIEEVREIKRGMK